MIHAQFGDVSNEIKKFDRNGFIDSRIVQFIERNDAFFNN